MVLGCDVPLAQHTASQQGAGWAVLLCSPSSVLRSLLEQQQTCAVLDSALQPAQREVRAGLGSSLVLSSRGVLSAECRLGPASAVGQCCSAGASPLLFSCPCAACPLPLLPPLRLAAAAWEK